MPKERISKEKRSLALMALFEGLGVNATCRLAGLARETLDRVLVETAEACESWHDKHFRGLSIARMEIDEQWSYVHTHKERMTLEERAEHRQRGDCWLWACIDADSKAVISWKTAKRSLAAAHSFSKDIAARVDGNTQVTSDLLAGYRYAIPAAFGERAAYATERKEFGKEWTPDANYLKKRVDPLKRVERRAVKGKPDLSTATVCHIERFFLTTRQGNKRLARKTLAYSKKWDNHAATSSVFAFIYNLVRKHEALHGRTPAQVLGVADKRWAIGDVVEMVEAFHKAKEDAAFESAFAAATFVEKQRPVRTYEPVKPKTPWYLDKDSGGKDALIRKAGVNYDA